MEDEQITLLSINLVPEEALVNPECRFEIKPCAESEWDTAFFDFLQETQQSILSMFALTPEELGALSNSPMSERAAWLRSAEQAAQSSVLLPTAIELHESTQTWGELGASTVAAPTTTATSGTLTLADLDALFDSLRDELPARSYYQVLRPYQAARWQEWERKARADIQRERQRQHSQARKLHRLRLRIRRKQRALARRRRKGLATR